MKLRITVKVPNWLDRICSWPAMAYRKRKYGYSYRRIHLTEGKFTIVDQQDFYELNDFDWVTKRNNKSFYAVRLDNDCAKWPTMVYMHRQIMNSPKGLLVDHRNCDGLDNRRENLRLATHSQNACNSQINKTKSKSRFRGVCLDKSNGRWFSTIRNHGKRIWLGYFDNEIETAKAYDEAARKYHGEFARLNFTESADSVQRSANS